MQRNLASRADLEEASISLRHLHALADGGGRTGLAEGLLEHGIAGGGAGVSELLIVHEHVWHVGGGRELLVVHSRGSLQQIIRVGALVAGIDTVPIKSTRVGALLGTSDCVGGSGLIHAREEGHGAGGVSLVESAQRNLFPIAVALLNASSSGGSDGGVQIEFDRRILLKVVEELYEVTRAELFAPGSFGTEEVADLTAGTDGHGEH